MDLYYVEVVGQYDPHGPFPSPYSAEQFAKGLRADGQVAWVVDVDSPAEGASGGVVDEATWVRHDVFRDCIRWSVTANV